MARNKIDNGWRVYWFRSIDGGTVSFRWRAGEAQERIEKKELSGMIRIEDPFRKGAPIGGYILLGENQDHALQGGRTGGD